MNNPKLQETRRKDILLVDDSFIDLHLLSDILTTFGYNVRPARSGFLALRSAKVKPPDLVLLDINMPDIDGYEVCRQLKSNSFTCSIPIIFVSIYSCITKRVRAFKAGGAGYITKPVDIDELLYAVRTNLV